MPRNVNFSRDEIGRVAFDLVREKGWDALTARAVGARLGVSVAPVYGAFASMDELAVYVLEEAARKINEYGERRYTEGSFLNRGAGLVAFARDEPNLFLALYRERRAGGVFDRYRLAIREKMPEDERLASLDGPTLDRIFDWLWTFSLGMVLSVLFGQAVDRSTEGIVRTLRAAGSVLMYGILSGMDEYGSPASKAAWARLLDEKPLGIPRDKLYIGIDPALGRKENQDK